MTVRLYYPASPPLTFSASVLSCEPVADRFEVVLDQTAFYPSSGGQPSDTGRLGGAEVIDVFDRDDGAIVHVLASALAVDGAVTGDVDEARRRDHMQQHTGQHVLSAAFDRTATVPTVSFHMGRESATIDLAREVTAAEVERAEALANDVVWEDRPVHVRFVSEEEARQLPLRKASTRTGTLRLIDVEGFDLSACGGTHVPRTGAIGLIAVSNVERFKGGSRVTFVCGARALESHRRLREVVQASTRVMAVTADQLPSALERRRDDEEALGRRIRLLQGELAGLLGAHLRAGGETIGGRSVVLYTAVGWDGAAIKGLAQAIVAAGGLVAVVAGDGQPAPVVVARSPGVAIDAANVLRALIAELGGKGGGRPELAQGGLPAPPDRILAAARAALS